MWRWFTLPLLLSLTLALAPAASAQSTGGSFGGGSFSDSSGSSGSGSSGSGGSSSSDDDAGDAEAFLWALVYAAMLVWEKPLIGVPVLLASLVLGWGWLVSDKRTKGWLSLFAWAWAYAITWAIRVDVVGYVMAALSMIPLLVLVGIFIKDRLEGLQRRHARIRKRDVCVVSLALDPGVRDELATRLTEIRGSGRSLFSTTKQLRQTAQALIEHRESWRGGYWRDFVMQKSAEAIESFSEEVGKARHRGQEILVTVEGSDVAVLTLVVYSKSELPQLDGEATKGEFAEAIEALEAISLFENRYKVIWSPDQDGAMGADEMKQKYPEIEAFEPEA